MSHTATPAKLDPLDPLAIESLLDGEERLIRDTVREYVRTRFLPTVAEHYEAGTFDAGIARELGELGLLGMHLEGYGCTGSTATAYGLACLELEAGDSGLRSFCSVQGSLSMFAIHRWGSEEQKERWLPAMASGEKLGCFGLTEPDVGLEPGRDAHPRAPRRRGLDPRREQDVDHQRDGLRRRGRLGANRRGRGNGFLVEAGTPGFSAPEMHHKLSLRASITSELVLDGVRVGEEARLPLATSLRGPLSCLNEARYGIVWGAAGAARACYEAALAYANSREQFDRPIASFQLTQAKLVEMAVKVNQGILLALHLGRMKDRGELTPEHVSFGKYANVAGALEVARSARTVLGATGSRSSTP